MAKTMNIGLRGPVALLAFALPMLALATPCRAQASDEAADLIDRVVEAYGGADALDALRAFRLTGETVSFMRGSAKGRIVRTFQAPDRLRVEIAYPGEAQEVRIFDGLEGWKQGQQAPPPLRDSMRLQAARIALPLLLLEARGRVKDLGSSPGEGGKTLRTLGLALDDHLALFVEIEVPGHRILRSRGQMRRAGAAMEFGAAYGDFRQWNGVLVPWREEHYAMGQQIGYTVVERLESLKEPAPATFRP